jgi:23S rRNA pseudouridine2457 synthase
VKACFLTDDGSLIKRLTDPRYHLKKTYWVLVEGNHVQAQFTQLEDGILIRGYLTLPAKACRIPDPGLPPRPKPVTPDGPTTWIELKLREGRKRQIPHMTAAIGLPTLRLVRGAIGQVRLGYLKPGEWRDLTPDEINSLK